MATADWCKCVTFDGFTNLFDYCIWSPLSDFATGRIFKYWFAMCFSCRLLVDPAITVRHESFLSIQPSLTTWSCTGYNGSSRPILLCLETRYLDEKLVLGCSRMFGFYIRRRWVNFFFIRELLTNAYNDTIFSWCNCNIIRSWSYASFCRFPQFQS